MKETIASKAIEVARHPSKCSSESARKKKETALGRSAVFLRSPSSFLS